MFGRRKKSCWDRKATIEGLEQLIADLRLKKELVEPEIGAHGQSDEMRRTAAEWIERSLRLLGDSAETLRISLPNPRRDDATKRETEELLERLTVVTEDVALIWSSAEEQLFPLAKAMYEAVKAYCSA